MFWYNLRSGAKALFLCKGQFTDSKQAIGSRLNDLKSYQIYVPIPMGCQPTYLPTYKVPTVNPLFSKESMLRLDCDGGQERLK